MKFKITEIKSNAVKVQYEDGSWADVPINKGQDKDTIYEIINSFGNVITPFDKTADVPVAISSDWDEYTPDLDPTVDYKSARVYHYPSLGDQMDALHWAREGDDTNLKAVDENIKTVKSKIAKGSTHKTSALKTLLD